MCRCSEKIPSWKELFTSLKNEWNELKEKEFKSQKEKSDVLRDVERIIEKGLGIKVELGGRLNTLYGKWRDKKHGCIHSRRRVLLNGGKCLSE